MSGRSESVAEGVERAATLGRTWTVKGKVTDSDGSGYLHDDDDDDYDDDCHDDDDHMIVMLMMTVMMMMTMTIMMMM